VHSSSYITDVNILYTHITLCSFKFVLYLRQTLQVYSLICGFSGHLILNIVKSHFSFISCTDIVQVFQSMFSDDMIANKWPLENRSMFFASLWNPSIFDGINQKKDKNSFKVKLLFLCSKCLVD
jgi:hypothetical protein